MLVLCLELRWSLTVPIGYQSHFEATLTAVSWVLFLCLGAILWLVDFDEPHDYDDWRASRWFCYASMGATMWGLWSCLRDGNPWWLSALVALSFVAMTALSAWRAVPRSGERLRGEPRREAFLVLTLDLTQDPPVGLWAAVYSCKASHLTSMGLEELHVDIESCAGDSYEQARREMLQKVPTYFPGLVPMLRRSGQLPQEAG
jgi:hypothetical protein